MAAISFSGAALAQESEIPRAKAYEQVTQWPDWQGVWNTDWSILFGEDGRRPPQEPKLTPEGQTRLDALRRKQEIEGIAQEAQEICLPPGMPSVMRQPYPIEFIFSPDRVTIFAEAYDQARRIYLDGRSLPEDPDRLFNGTSVGHWEGDTLVVETVGINPLVNIVQGIGSTEQSRIKERFWLKEPGQMIVETTIIDPILLAEPFTETTAYRVQPDWEIREYVCAENNRLRNEAGGANIDLGLDDDDDPFGPE